MFIPKLMRVSVLTPLVLHMARCRQQAGKSAPTGGRSGAIESIFQREKCFENFAFPQARKFGTSPFYRPRLSTGKKFAFPQASPSAGLRSLVSKIRRFVFARNFGENDSMVRWQPIF